MILAKFPLSISDISGLVQAVGVVISLVYLARQIQESTKAAKCATYQSIITAFADIEARISQDAEIARIYKTGQTNFESLNENEAIRFNQLIASFFNLYENLFYQYKNNLLEEELWAGWCRNMRYDLEKDGIKKWWISTSRFYSQSFREYIRSGKYPKD